MKKTNKISVKIWDVEGRPPVDKVTTVLWRGFVDPVLVNCVSIPELIENNAEFFRAQYLSYVYEFGEMRINGTRLIDYLQLRYGFSYWWMTLLSEKCNFAKSPFITDAISLIAFIEWVKEREISQITLISENKMLAHSLSNWAAKSGVEFKFESIHPQLNSNMSMSYVYSSIKHVFHAMGWLIKYLLIRWPLRGQGLKKWRQTPGLITFFSYSDNCLSEALEKNQYENRYWGHLPELLRKESCVTNWLHIYVSDTVLPTPVKAEEELNKINSLDTNQQCHVTLDTFLGPFEILQTLKDWMHCLKLSLMLEKDIAKIQDQKILNFWPLMRTDWQKSMFGADAMSNLLNFNLMHSAIKSLPIQKHGVYLQENMNWEFGLIHVWNAEGHGQLTGAPHSTVRFWDLRYFFDPRSYKRTGINDLPMPNQVACNGPVMLSTFQQCGYPDTELKIVEALRYLHIEQTKLKRQLVMRRNDGIIHLLVIGDYLASNTRAQMKLLEQALLSLSAKIIVIVKPHPNCTIHKNDYPDIKFKLSKESISKLLIECDVAFTSAGTSAAIDAYYSGVPIISLLDPNTLNLSPLRGCEGVQFVGTPDELASAINLLIINYDRSKENKSEYFSIGPELLNWRRLLL